MSDNIDTGSHKVEISALQANYETFVNSLNNGVDSNECILLNLNMQLKVLSLLYPDFRPLAQNILGTIQQNLRDISG